MIVPGLPSLVLLAYCLVLLPLAAIRSARVINKARAVTGELPVSRRAIWIQTLISQGLLLLITWLAASSFGYQIFWRPPIAPPVIGAGIVALVLCLFLRVVGRSVRSAAERRDLVVFALAPRTTAEALLLSATIVLASIAEEAAYRGVLVAILTYVTGTSSTAIAVSAVAFAVAHATQGVKSGVMIFAVALVMHALVAATGTLVVPMVVHGLFDLIAAALIAREAKIAELTPIGTNGR